MQPHWDRVYAAKKPDQVSWFRPHLETSLALIERATRGDLASSIIDVGGGASTLMDDLLLRGYRNLTVLDISQAALDTARERLGPNANRVRWLRADITQADLEEQAFDVWHDRAVFHFLVNEWDRRAYMQALERAMKPGGNVVIATFGPQGPTKCSGLETVRYGAESLQVEMGERLELLESFLEAHTTPSGLPQQFLYALFRVRK